MPARDVRRQLRRKLPRVVCAVQGICAACCYFYASVQTSSLHFAVFCQQTAVFFGIACQSLATQMTLRH